MGSRGTQRSLCCHTLFSTGALWCLSTHIRYGRPGAKEPACRAPFLTLRSLCFLGSDTLGGPAASRLWAAVYSRPLAVLSSPPDRGCLPPHTCSPHLIPFLSRLSPSSPASRASRDLGKRHLLVAHLLIQFR